MLGKRVDFSSRSVISPTTSTNINILKIPFKVVKHGSVPLNITRKHIKGINIFSWNKYFFHFIKYISNLQSERKLLFFKNINRLSPLRINVYWLIKD